MVGGNEHQVGKHEETHKPGEGKPEGKQEAPKPQAEMAHTLSSKEGSGLHQHIEHQHHHAHAGMKHIEGNNPVQLVDSHKASEQLDKNAGGEKLKPGEHKTTYPDGHSVITDAKGNPTEVDYPGQKPMTIRYHQNKDGTETPEHIQAPDGSTYNWVPSSPGGATWSRIDPSGHSETLRDCDVKVNPDGQVAINYTDSHGDSKHHQYDKQGHDHPGDGPATAPDRDVKSDSTHGSGEASERNLSPQERQEKISRLMKMLHGEPVDGNMNCGPDDYRRELAKLTPAEVKAIIDEVKQKFGWGCQLDYKDGKATFAGQPIYP
jgi:hypothetical protein